MCNCKYCSKKFEIDPENHAMYPYWVCLNRDSYHEDCFVGDSSKCKLYEPSEYGVIPKDGICQNITKENSVDDFICSNCGIHLYDWLKVSNGDLYEYEFKYCPNCGAKVVD